MFCRILLIAATYLTLVYPAVAQSQAVQPKDGQGWVSIDFPGGSLADYVDLLHKSCPELNVVVNSDAADLAIQPIELRNVRPESTIAILERLYPQQLDVSGLGGEFSVVVIGCVDSDSAGFRTEIVSIRGLLEGPHGIPLDQIMAVIESALSLDAAGADMKPIIRVHKETGMLMLKASERDLDTVAAVIEQLRSSAHEARGLARQVEVTTQLRKSRRVRKRLTEMGKEMEDLHVEAARLRDELIRREQMIAELQGQLERHRAKPTR